MYKKSVIALVLFGALNANAVAAQRQSDAKPRECPSGSFQTSLWVPAREPDLGIELARPSDYQAHHWESVSDTSRGVAISFWRNAANTIDFNGLGSTSRDRSIVPCLIHLRSGDLEMRIERTTSKLSGGGDTTYFIGRGVITPVGMRLIHVQTGARDSTALLEQLEVLRTIRFLRDR